MRVSQNHLSVIMFFPTHGNIFGIAKDIVHLLDKLLITSKGTRDCTMTYKYHYRKEEFGANYALTREDKVADPFPMDVGMPEYSLDGIRRNDDAAKLFKPTMHLLFAWFHDVRKDTGKRFIMRDIVPVNKRDLL
ncbi:hypothetical protein BJ741DRAFT_671900 [Chytriomyces cf. hyalinus JEL632]|nr:hypothetical protein BJ741DRAFT_671900 [Chytriomyces cf. hyalinus JEL632]